MPLDSHPSAIRTTTSCPRRDESGRCLFALSVLFFFLLLPSCALVHHQGDGATAKETGMEKSVPEPGDIKTFDGVEYVYGRNRRFPSLRGEPEYTWVRKDQLAPRPFDSLKEALQRPAPDRGEIEELEKRISRLEEEIEGLGAVAETAGAGGNR